MCIIMPTHILSAVTHDACGLVSTVRTDFETYSNMYDQNVAPILEGCLFGDGMATDGLGLTGIEDTLG